MVSIKPFKAYKYNIKKVNIQDVITPPYDVIDEEMNKSLQSKSEYNFVNLILNDKNENAGKLLQKWIKENILIQDDQDSIYVYEQIFSINNKEFKRTGFVCLLRLEECGNNIMPHEMTFDKVLDDRFDLMVKTNSNLGNIFMIYEDKNKEIDRILEEKSNKELEFIDDENCVHSIYKLPKEKIDRVKKLMQDKKLLIADGHHRYKTALRYKNNYDHVMVTLVNSNNKGMIILPTNRVLNKKIDINDFKEYFNIKTTENLNFGKNSFIIISNGNKYLITLKEKNNNLDVEILHNLIFEKIIKIPKQDQIHPIIKFIKGNERTLKEINEKNTIFLVNPPTLEKVFKIANNHKILPQKSTYFYPKMFSGLLINKFKV